MRSLRTQSSRSSNAARSSAGRARSTAWPFAPASVRMHGHRRAAESRDGPGSIAIAVDADPSGARERHGPRSQGHRRAESSRPAPVDARARHVQAQFSSAAVTSSSAPPSPQRHRRRRGRRQPLQRLSDGGGLVRVPARGGAMRVRSIQGLPAASATTWSATRTCSTSTNPTPPSRPTARRPRRGGRQRVLPEYGDLLLIRALAGRRAEALHLSRGAEARGAAAS